MKLIPFDSPLYPLPSDYASLTVDGQRLARVNASRQFLLHPERSEARAEAHVHSLHFFDQYYLWPDEETEFDPGFYDVHPLPTPTFHYDVLRAMVRHKFFVAVMPRGASKSTLVLKNLLLLSLAQPRIPLVYATSTGDNALSKGQQVRDQLYTNPRIFNDFAPLPEFGGRIQPPRGTAPSGNEHIFINSRSNIRFVSVNSRLRGIRPRGLIIDDPEADSTSEFGPEKIRSYMEQLLFKVGYYAIQRPGTFMWWVGTFVSKKHFLYKAMQVDASGYAIDSRFDRWARLFVPAGYHDETGKLRSVWPQMWPADDAERALHSSPDAETLEEMAAGGLTDFNSEMMGRPADSGTAHFALDPTPTGAHAWWVKDEDPEFTLSPTTSKASICWEHAGLPQSLEVPRFLEECYLFITCDHAYTSKVTSDYKVACVMAHKPSENLLFVLDMWAGKKSIEVFVEEIFRLAAKWNVPCVFPEIVKQGIVLYDSLRAAARTRALDVTGITHVPAIKPIRPGMVDKVSRIAAALTLRFDHNLIKLPLYAVKRQPWMELVSEIENFNPEAESGGLEHDDLLDAVSMSSYVVAGRVRRLIPTSLTTPSASRPHTVAERLSEIKAGRLVDPITGIPHATFLLNTSALNDEAIQNILTPDLSPPSEGPTLL